MTLRRVRVAIGVGVVLGCGVCASANGDFCSSQEFHKAFLEGQSAADFPTIGPRLRKLGDSAVPCLKTIARGGGADLGITECNENPRKCPAWAISGLSAIGTAKARNALLALLGLSQDPVALAEVMGGVTSLRMHEAAPRIRTLLEHESPYVRGEAILDLGTLGDHSDFDRMVSAAQTVVPDQLNKVVRGLELLGDPRAVGALEDLKRKVTEPVLQAEIQRSIDRIRGGKAIRPDPRQ